MEPHQLRVVEERNELFVRLARLRRFMQTAAFDQLPPDERDRLKRQEVHMTGYANVLVERVLAF